MDEDLWEEINQIRIKGKWDHEDIETLVFYISNLTALNGEVADRLGQALESLAKLHRKVEFYHKCLGIKVVT